MLATVFASNGEITVLAVTNGFVLDVVEERSVRRDVVQEHNTHLELTRRDAVKLRRTLTAMLRKPRPQAASTAPVLAEECAVP